MQAIENQPTFRRNMLPPSRGLKNLYLPPAFMLVFALRWRKHVPPRPWLTFNGLHNIISQKTELFITASQRTPQNSVHTHKTEHNTDDLL
jgi:hypothetical protein